MTPEQQRALAVANARRRQAEGQPVAQTESSGPLMDSIKTLPGALVKGGAELLTLPVTLDRLGSAAVGSVVHQLDKAGRWALGYPQLSPEEYAQRNATAEGAINRTSVGRTAQDAALGAIERNRYQPQTRTGQYVDSVAQMVPGGMIGPGGVVPKMIANAVMPGVAVQAAREVSPDSTWAPIVAGTVAQLAGTRAMSSLIAPEIAMTSAAGDVTPQQLDAARDLMARAQQRGVTLSMPEAIQEATGGATKLPELMRTVEGSVQGGTIINNALKDRPQQVSNAVGSMLDDIAPAPAAPSALGPRMSGTADDILNNARQGVNAQTRPLYQAAEPQALPDATFAPIASDPAFQEALGRLRADPVLGAQYAGMPDNSVAIVDAVSKDLFSRGQMRSNSANPLYGPERGALETGSANAARSSARAAVPEYDAALTQQTQLRNEQLLPLEAGPLGRVARAGNTTAAGEGLMRGPVTAGASGEVADAVKRMAAQDPDGTAQLLRQYLAQNFQDTVGRAAAPSIGWRFVDSVGPVKGGVRSDMRESLISGLDALPNPQGSNVDDVFSVLQATRNRLPPGSPTAEKSQWIADLGTRSGQNMGEQVMTGGLSRFTPLFRAARARALYGQNVGALAETMVDPKSIDTLAAALAKGSRAPYSEAFLRSAYNAVRDPRELPIQ